MCRLLTASCVCVAFSTVAANALVIDHFDAEQFLMVNMNSPEAFGEVTGPSDRLLGGARDVRITRQEGNTSFVEIVGGASSLNNGSGGVTQVEMRYDGAGSEGLGGVDLTDDGASDRFLISVLEADANAVRYTVRLRDGAGQTAEVFSDFPAPVLPEDPEIEEIVFASFLSNNPSLDLGNIDEVSLFFEATAAADLRLDFIATNSSTSVPLPASLVLLLAGLAGLGTLRQFRRG
ncbi:MAG: VPLPA-CTERM sorting domain-containing protein [Pikeienuella sp.]